MSFALTTKERIKERLSINSNGFDALFDRLILATTARIETMCNRHFMLAEYNNELYDGSDIYGSLRHILMVKNAPLSIISDIQYKAGSNSSPTWTAYDLDDYDADVQTGLIHFRYPMPRGKQNIRISYTGGFSGFDIGVSTYWKFNRTPAGAVDGSNLVFTLPENASELVVYADGLRILSSNYAFTPGSSTFAMNAGQAPYSAISVDYKQAVASSSGEEPTLPLEVVEVCEEVVVRLFKKRDMEGRSSETLGESTITWRENVFTPENLATIKNYRRSSFV